MLTERGCFGENSGRRRCRTFYTEHQGKGYSDHLGIAADFRLWGTGIPGRVGQVERIQPNVLLSSRIESGCTATSDGSRNYPDLKSIDWNDEVNLGKCVRLEFGKHPAKLLTRGIYDSGYLQVNGKPLGVGMVGAYDPRPVIQGVPQARAAGERGMSPLSNMCFARKVLQKTGGRVVRAVGRLGYDNGMLSILMARREDISLVDLPAEKRDACR
jgi:hypothetical protein